MEEKVEESDILDYKQDLLLEDCLIKHVCAFANTRGGDLIFGVKESGDGGHPVEIMGVDSVKIRKEKMENLILAHITPRLEVKIKEIPIPDKAKSILLIRIPDSYARPHCGKDKRYYKRFNFKAEPMTEREIADLYKKRFSNHEEVNQYLGKILPAKSSDTIIGNIAVIPSNIEHRMINTFDPEKIRWFETIKLKSYNDDSGYSIAPCTPVPSSYGLTATRRFNNSQIAHYLHIHRNGCIHLTKNFHSKLARPPNSLNAKDLSLRLMETLQFACMVMCQHNYWGELKILVVLTGPSETIVPELLGVPFPEQLYAKIEREFPLDFIQQNYEEVAACIMHEVVNYYHLPRCRYFDDKDKWNLYNQR